MNTFLRPKSVTLVILSLLLVSSILWAETNTEEAYQSANNLFRSEEYDLAADEFEKLSQQNSAPEIQAKSAFKAAECYFLLKEYKKAGGLFKKYLVGFPNHESRADAQFRFSESFYQQGDYESAARSYDRFIRDNPTHKYVPEALYATASAYAELGQLAEALTYYTRLSRNHATHPKAKDALFNSAWVYLRASKFEKSSQLYLEYHKKYPESKLATEALLRAADSDFRRSIFTQSLKLYNRVLAEGEGAFSGEATEGIAWSYFKLGEFDKSARTFIKRAEKVQKVNVKADAYYQAIQAFYSASNINQGLASAEAMIANCAKHPMLAEAHYWKGLFHKKQGDLKKAVIDFKKALSLPESKTPPSEIKLELASMLIQLQRADEAVAILKEAATYAKDSSLYGQIIYELSRALHLQGKTAEAIEFTQKLLDGKHEKSNITQLSIFSLGEFNFSIKDYPEASRSYKSVIANSTSAGLVEDARYRLGWSYKLMNQDKSAIATFSKIDLGQKSKYQREVRYILAELYEKTGNKKLARENYQALIDQRGEFSTDSFLAMADILFKNREYKEAQKLCEKFSLEFPGHELEGDILFILAESSDELGDHKKSLSSYDLILASQNKLLRENTLYSRGWLLYEMSSLEKALSDFDTLIKEFPKSDYISSSVQLRGKILISLNRKSEAREVFQKGLGSVDNKNDQESFLLSLAGVEADLSNYPKALEHYENFLNKYPNSPKRDRALFEKGWLYVQMEKNELASQAFREYKKLYSTGGLIADVDFSLGELAYGLGKLDEALAYYSECRSSARYKDKSLYKSAWCRLKSKEFASAAILFGSLVEECPKSPLHTESIFRKGICLMQASDFHKSIAAFEQYIKVGRKDSFYSQALFNMGKVYEKLNQTDKAEDKYQDYIKLNPKGEARLNCDFRLGGIKLAKGEYVEARRHYNNILSDKTHYLALEVRYYLGETFFQQKMYKDAIKAYLQTKLYQEGQKWQAAAMLRVSKSHQALGNTAKAKKYLRDLIQEYPKSEEAKVASQKLQK